MTRQEYRESLGLPDLGLDEKWHCPRCGEYRDRERPDGCRDFDCPDMLRTNGASNAAKTLHTQRRKGRDSV